MRCGRKWLILGLGAICGSFPVNCLSRTQQELELLLAPEANPALIQDSALIDWFGPGILDLFD
jgi:hypothetical protein